MATLHSVFLNTISEIGMARLEHPILYHAPIGIRFEIGDEEDGIYTKRGKANPVYVEKAFHRAKEIFDSLPAFDLLRFDIYTEDRTEWPPRPLDLEDLSNIGLPQPKEKRTDIFHDDEGEDFEIEVLYWDLSYQKIDFDKLLTEIIKADIGGFNELASAIYFVNTKEKIMYHLYDDRGLDVVAGTVETLQPYYENYNAWLLEYDREEIDQIFKVK